MTAPVTPTPIVAYSGSLPDPSDSTTYGTRGRALWAWEVGALFSGINLIATQTNTNAVSAAESAEAAMLSSGATMWSAATNYATGTVAKSPTDMQSYSRNAPGGVNATDPAASANWTLVGGKFYKKAGDTLTGNMELFNDPTTNIVLTASQYMGALPSDSNVFVRTAPMFRNKVANEPTYVGVEPNGTGGASGFFATSGGSIWGALTVSASGMRLRSGHAATLSVPLSWYFNFGGVDKASVDPAGVFGGYGMRFRAGTAGATLGNSVNLYWTGTVTQLWVDTTNTGTITVTSDYRLKKDVQDMEPGALARLAKLRPVSFQYQDYEPFNFRADGVIREGFIAHELAAVVPSAVDGEKDAPNQMQSLRLDPLVALLVKAVQEQQAQISEMQRRLDVLEG